jgi:hypothetical protein
MPKNLTIMQDDVSISQIMYDALGTFPETMTKEELIKECARYMKTDQRIWVKPESFAWAMKSLMKDYLGYSRHKKIFTNYRVKDMKGKLRVR